MHWKALQLIVQEKQGLFFTADNVDYGSMTKIVEPWFQSVLEKLGLLLIIRDLRDSIIQWKEKNINVTILIQQQRM